MSVPPVAKICLVPFKPHLQHLYSWLGRSRKVVAFSRFGVVGTPAVAAVEFQYYKVWTLGLATITRILRMDFHPPNYIPRLQTMLRDESPSAIVMFDFYHWYLFQCLMFKRKTRNVNLVLYSETKRWPTNFFSKIIMRFFLWFVRNNRQAIHRIFVYTTEGNAWWQENAPEVRVEIMPAPVDVEAFTPPGERVWLPNGTLRILMNARYNLYKRHEDLLQAVTQLRGEGRLLHVTFIGRADSGRERVERLVEKYGLGEVVTFLDPLPMSEMPALYHQHDVLVLPSYNEAIGMVVPEAMACGVPTITSDTVGANVYVKEGETGWVCETGSAAALAAALRECYNAAELARRGAAARAHVAAHFSVPIIAERFLTLLDERS